MLPGCQEIIRCGWVGGAGMLGKRWGVAGGGVSGLLLFPGFLLVVGGWGGGGCLFPRVPWVPGWLRVFLGLSSDFFLVVGCPGLWVGWVGLVLLLVWLAFACFTPSTLGDKIEQL